MQLTHSGLDDFKQTLQARFDFMARQSNPEEHNSYNFRSNEIATPADICYYGCSFTYGVGVPLESRWTNIIDRELNFVSNNFGIGGIGIDEILNIFVATSRLVTMQRAVFLLPAIGRQSIAIPNDKYVHMLPGNASGHGCPDTKEHARIWYQLPREYFIDQAKISMQIIQRLAELQDILCVFATWDPELYDCLPGVKTVHAPNSDYLGSDGQHPGTQWHANLAQEVIKLL